MMAVNTNNPGKIIVAIVSTSSFSGSGPVVTINFTTHTAEGSISLVKTDLIDANAGVIPSSGSAGTAGSTGSSGFFADAGLPFSNPATTTPERQQQSTQSTSTATTAIAAAPSIGTITLPGDPASPAQPQKTAELPLAENQQGYLATPPTREVARSAEKNATEETPPPAATKKADIKQIRYASILERFGNFRGERTLAALTRLYNIPVAEQSRQEPLIVINDGKSLVKIFAKISASDKNSLPTVATKDAKLLSLKYDESAAEWVIELTPRSETIDASVSMLFDNRLIEIPLILVPPVAKQFSFTEVEAVAFLKDFDAEKPGFDLNKDGKHDYIDDYIYIGHYLLNNKQGKTTPEQPEKNPKTAPTSVKKKK
jgi:hypothetical protein